VRRREGPGTDIFTIGVDGSDEKRLTDDTDEDGNPSWSADGSKVVCARFSMTTFRTDIWVVNADGSGSAQLTSGSSDSNFPAFSPDGKKIVFQRFAPTGQPDILVMNASDGANVTNLTNGRSPATSRIGGPRSRPLPLPPQILP
jgi:Tol biopolymer transport system component